ncbi:hypothetical protein BSL78_18010 [Apostichopus japonicus]|uniref:Uncharacterized protein n=1 Tax=Stichopus japonicus TaxID=307972 RepID=A0A2G8KAV2_STIJA|nr:hypothetical protein BSL78_18010 [Apostichopus japonicus]
MEPLVSCELQKSCEDPLKLCIPPTGFKMQKNTYERVSGDVYMGQLYCMKQEVGFSCATCVLKMYFIKLAVISSCATCVVKMYVIKLVVISSCAKCVVICMTKRRSQRSLLLMTKGGKWSVQSAWRGRVLWFFSVVIPPAGHVRSHSRYAISAENPSQRKLIYFCDKAVCRGWTCYNEKVSKLFTL